MLYLDSWILKRGFILPISIQSTLICVVCLYYYTLTLNYKTHLRDMLYSSSSSSSRCLSCTPTNRLTLSLTGKLSLRPPTPPTLISFPAKLMGTEWRRPRRSTVSNITCGGNGHFFKGTNLKTVYCLSRKVFKDKTLCARSKNFRLKFVSSKLNIREA